MLRTHQASSSGCARTAQHKPFCAASLTPRRRSIVKVQAHASHEEQGPQPAAPAGLSRRQAMAALTAGVWGPALLGSSSTLLAASPALAFTAPPPGFRLQLDRLDGYSFFYPERWLAVTVTGNDCFFRNPANIDENLFVDISSPSSSQYNSVTDLGTPEQTAQQILNKYLNEEFMSTRLGIKREGKILSFNSRTGQDGRTYYDVAVRMTSYASRNPYVATQGEVMSQYGVEWDRVLLTTLGVANKRLYELRLQTAQNTLDASLPVLGQIASSFTLNDVEA